MPSLSPGPSGAAPRLLRLAAWGGSALLLAALAALALLAAVATLAWLRSGGLGDFQWGVWRLLLGGLVLQAVAPQVGLSVLLWPLAVRLYPAVETSWRGLRLGVPLVAALAFLPVGAVGFPMWTPTTLLDVLNTVLLLAGGCAACLLLPRRLPFLRPGALAAGPAATDSAAGQSAVESR